MGVAYRLVLLHTSIVCNVTNRTETLVCGSCDEEESDLSGSSSALPAKSVSAVSQSPQIRVDFVAGSAPYALAS